MNNNTNNATGMGQQPTQYGNQHQGQNIPNPNMAQNPQMQSMQGRAPMPQQQFNNQPRIQQQTYQNVTPNQTGQPNMQQPINQNTMPNQPMQQTPIANQQMNRMPNNPQMQRVPNNNPINQQNIQQPITPQPVPNAPIQNIPVQPQTASPVQPMQQVAPQDIVINNNNSTTTQSQVTPSVIEETSKDKTRETNDISDVADITFDYNSIYGVPQDKNEIRENEEKEKPIFTAQEIVIENRDLEGRKADDVVPEFNINALDANTTESDSKLTDNVLNDKQQDKADTRRKILFIAVLVALLVISVGFIFPIISGNKF